MLVRILLFTVMVFLSGCALPSHLFNSDPKEFETVPAEHGMVVFQSVVIDRGISRYISDWSIFRASRIGGAPMTWLKKNQRPPMRYNVYPVYDALPGTLLWVGVLPEGNYLAEDFYASFHTGQVYGYHSQPLLDSHASFRIEPGRVTLLDSYLYKSFGQTALQANVESPHDLLAMARERFPDIMSDVDTGDPVRFSPLLTQDDDEAERLEEMARWTSTVGFAWSGPDGRIYRIAKLGQIFERSPEGKWRRVTLDTFEPLESLYAADNGEAIAITNGGATYHRVHADAEFVPLVTGIEHVQNLARLPDGTWVAASRHTKSERRRVNGRMQEVDTYELELLKSDSLTGTWTSIAHHAVEKGYADAYFVGWQAFVGNPGGRGFVIDLQSGARSDLPSGFLYLRDYGDNKLLALEDGNWPRVWSSDDSGKTWVQLERVQSKGMPALTRDGRIALVGDLYFSSPAQKWRYDGLTRGLLVTKPSWDKWLVKEELPEACSGWVEYLELEEMRLMFCDLDVFRQLKHTNHWAPENMRGLREEERTEAKGFAVRNHARDAIDGSAQPE